REAIKNALLTFADRKIIEIGPSEKRKGPKLTLLEPFIQQEKLDELAETIRRYITSKS
ncbi:MAG: hypothetical protein JRJ87_15955, partial [Deltaproteobacteria bacterium]|nr:hypothetical protein [Deltaproteobacteria bacterium]